MNRHRNLSFYIETLVLLFFLLVALVVLIRVFGAAQAFGLQSRQKTDAATILQTVSAQFSAQKEPFDEASREAVSTGQAQVDFLCDQQGNVSSGGNYRVTVSLRAEEQPAGTIVFADIEISCTSQEEPPLAILETSLYCPKMTGEGEQS